MRVWLTGMTNEGNENDLRDLIEPIKNDFHGLIWVFHYPKDDGAKYLESVKGEGEIIYTKWCNRFSFSRNHCLFQGPMKVGDWFLIIDTLERLSPDFTKSVKNLCAFLNQNDIDGAYLYNKRFLFQLNETTEFTNNPHEAILGCNKTIELSDQSFWKKEYLKNVRSKKRNNPYHFIEHNFKYYFLPNTNHLFLGFENQRELVEQRYINRNKLIREIYESGFDPFNIESIEDCFRNHITDDIRECINFDKFLNDWYRYKILDQKVGFIDKHDFSCFQKIKF
tara:strand:- start:6563 stop:7402 length:840 start_codon:yes stop_codon:yes gene_type:complete